MAQKRQLQAKGQKHQAAQFLGHALSINPCVSFSPRFSLPPYSFHLSAARTNPPTLVEPYLHHPQDTALIPLCSRATPISVLSFQFSFSILVALFQRPAISHFLLIVPMNAARRAGRSQNGVFGFGIKSTRRLEIELAF